MTALPSHPAALLSPTTRALAASLLALVAAAPVQSATLFSENFDGVTPGAYANGASVGGFVVAAGAADVLGNLGGSNLRCPNAAPNNCADLAGAGGLLASLASGAAFDLVAGRRYELSFVLAGRAANVAPSGLPEVAPAAATYTVEVGLGAMRRSFDITDDSGFVPRAHTFVAAAAESGARLSFTALNGGTASGPVIDNVLLSAVPEPATTVLSFAGLLVVLAAARHRRIG